MRIRLALQHPGAGADVTVAVDDPELDVVAVQPLVIVNGGPVEQAPYVDTAGVLLLTDDGALAHVLTHPRFGVEKTYRALLRGRLTSAQWTTSNARYQVSLAYREA